MYPIDAFGSEKQKRNYLPSLAKGDLIGCFGLTEAEAGSDPGGMKTRAEKVDGEFISITGPSGSGKTTLLNLIGLIDSIDEGKILPEMISIVKRNNCGKALEISRVARDLHGGNGIMEDYDIMRHMCNLETVNTYEGTHDVHALILGRSLTGLQAFF